MKSVLVFALQLLCSLSLFAESATFSPSQEPFYYFLPPVNWKVADPSKLSKTIKIAFVSDSKKPFKPSLNLGVEKVNASLQDYIQVVKKHHQMNRKNRWHELGYVQTQSGQAHLSQIDTKAEFGDIRTMQCICIQNSYAYVMTAVALREEFLDYHNDFLKAFESFSIHQDALHSLPKHLQQVFHTKSQELIKAWSQHCLASKNRSLEDLFSKGPFQKNHWKDFEKFLTKTFKTQGLVWQVMASKELKHHLFDLENTSKIAINQ